MHFKKIYIEINNGCNLACSFCIKNERAIHALTLDEFELIIQQIKPYGIFVYLHVLGEPLLHPNLKGILAICEAYAMKVHITTNGTLINNYLDVLCETKCLRLVNFSIHSFSEQSNIQQDVYLDNILAASKKLASSDIYVSLRLWSLVDHKLDNTTKMLAEYFYNSFNMNISYETVKLAHNIYLNFDEVFEWPSLNNPVNNIESKCLGLSGMIGILSNGEVVICCLDSKGDTSIGNIFKEPLKDILNKPLVQDIIDGFNKNKSICKLCQHCTFRNRFLK
ncbi:MAG: radical SAM/SPASM domain-containing protein [Erysipelotrichaceae bacterium]